MSNGAEYHNDNNNNKATQYSSQTDANHLSPEPGSEQKPFTKSKFKVKAEQHISIFTDKNYVNMYCNLGDRIV